MARNLRLIESLWRYGIGGDLARFRCNLTRSVYLTLGAYMDQDKLQSGEVSSKRGDTRAGRVLGGGLLGMLLALFLTAFILVYDVSHGGQAGILLFLVWPVVFVGLIGGVAGMLGGFVFDLGFPTRTLPRTTPI